MKVCFSAITLLGFLLSIHVSNAWSQEAPRSPSPQEVEDHHKQAQTGMQFLTVSVNARAAALNGAVTSLDLGSASMFHNPAGMAHMKQVGALAVSNVQWIFEMGFTGTSLALRPFQGQYGVLGVTIRSVDYGEFQGTIRANNSQGYIETGVFRPSALAVGLGYAKALTDRFSVGGNVKYVTENLGSSVMSLEDPEDFTSKRITQSNMVGTMAFDFGVMYRTGFRSLVFAMSVRNFAPAVEYEEEPFELPMTLNIGLSMDLMDLVSPSAQRNHSFRLLVDATTPRDYYEQLSVAGEYVFMDFLALRVGYTGPSDERGISFGGGVHTSVEGIAFGADYAYTQFGDLGTVNQFSIQLGF